MSKTVFHWIRDEIFPALDYVELQRFGEPMLAKNFDYFFQTAIDYKVKTGLITNGTRLNQAYLEAFVGHHTKLTVSIDGATEKTYNHIRPKADFPALIGNLKTYKALKSQDGNSSSLLTVIFVAMRSNIEELPLMVDLCKTIGADRLVIARHGRPVARMMPVRHSASPRKPGSAKGKFRVPPEFFEPLPDEILNAFEQ